MASSAAAVATLSPKNIRIVSRRAQHILQKHAPNKSPGSAGGKAGAKAAEKEAPWPPTLRYLFYTVCTAAVPFSIGTAISMSPRLRDLMLGDETTTDAEGKKTTSNSAALVNFVRQYWGVPEYFPPVDQPSMTHVVPGKKNAWEEDNWSSFLKLMGLYSSPSSGSTTGSSEEILPLSFENEPPSTVRRQQEILSNYLSPAVNPSGVKTRLSLIPSTIDPLSDPSEQGLLGNETVHNLPPNVSLKALREEIHMSDIGHAQKVLKETFPSLESTVLFENKSYGGGSGSGSYRWVLQFADTDEDNNSSSNITDDAMDNLDGDMSSERLPEGAADAKILRHCTSINSSWSYFPNISTSSNGLKSGATTNPSMKAAANSGSATSNADNSKNIVRIQQLEYQIASLQNEMKDSASLRDRDTMEEELKLFKSELRSLQPRWWRRVWG